MLAIDIDGTLLNSERRVTERVRSSLQVAQSNGLIICLATGRLIPTLLPIAEEADVSGPVVTCNGAYAEMEDGETVFSANLSQEVVADLLQYAESNGITANVYQPRRVLSNRESPMLDLYRSRTGANPIVLPYEELAQEPATKMIFINEPSANASDLDLFSSNATDGKFHLTVSEPIYLEFLPPNVNKGIGVKAVASRLGLDASEVAAIGDFHNDREMIEWAGLGAAMASGAQAVKQVADIVMPSNDEDGVAIFIEHILASR
ncbi:MAG: HAD family phosphatase [Fimbriimonadaceae bacterium]|nr:HAD family phosphatase [Fimbriimonadaceae bacterium]